MTTDKLLTPAVLALECALTVGRIRQLIQGGTIPAIRMGERMLLITRADAEKFKARRERERNTR
jgi:hypothetical protein